MLDITFIRKNPKVVAENCAQRGVKVDIDALLALDEKRRTLIASVEALRAQRKQGSKGKPSPEEIERLRVLGNDIVAGEQKLAALDGEYTAVLMRIPNLTHPEVPEGGEDDFKVLAEQGTPPSFDFAPKDHEALLIARGLLDMERGAKVSGAKFYYALGNLVRLNQALIAYGIGIASARGYTLMETPDLAKNEILTGIGFAPRGPESQVYSVEASDLSLIGTAEITVGGFHAGEILDLSAGPKKYAALSHCFRTEAGAHGRVSKGLYRVHQFTKLELFAFCEPSQSEQLHGELLAIEREIADGLGLAYRVIDVASGDLGGPAYRKYDIEAWMAMKNGFGEITSTSNCTDYQARRLGIRYRTPDGATAFVHTLNGTAITTSRLPIAIVEQFQQADGTVRLPKALHGFMGGMDTLA
jgi:seryl-tRNA synthetase